RIRASRAPDPAVSATASAPWSAPGDADDAGRERARRAAHAAWDELMDTVVDYQLDTLDVETPRTTVERLVRRGRLGTDVAGSLRLLGMAEEQARYARTPHDPSGLRAASRQVRDALSLLVPRGRRLVALVAPRSVLRGWRAGTVNAVTGTVATLGTWRHRVLRAVTPRRLFAARSNRP
ncbi:MAG: transglutaminase domain-containing protein, partial [Actinocatenispora sp.]